MIFMIITTHVSTNITTNITTIAEETINQNRCMQRPPPVLGGGRIIDVVLELPENTHRHILPVLEPFQDFLIKLDMKPIFASSENKRSFNK